MTVPLRLVGPLNGSLACGTDIFILKIPLNEMLATCQDRLAFCGENYALYFVNQRALVFLLYARIQGRAAYKREENELCTAVTNAFMPSI